MLLCLDDLDGGEVSILGLDAVGQRHLWKTNSSGIRPVIRPCDLKHGYHGERAVDRLSSETQVDVHEVSVMSGKPTRLKGHGSAPAEWPVCAVVRRGCSSARVYPLHAKGECLVDNQIVASPSGVSHHHMSLDEGSSYGDKGDENRRHFVVKKKKKGGRSRVNIGSGQRVAAVTF